MAFLNSAILLQPDGLYKAVIRYSYLYFYVTEDHEKFRTIQEAKDWILSKRCPVHQVITQEEEEPQEQENCETEAIQGDAFENDSDEEKKEEKKVVLNLDDIKQRNRNGKRYRFVKFNPYVN